MESALQTLATPLSVVTGPVRRAESDLPGLVLTLLEFNESGGLPPVRPPPGIVPELQNPPQAGQDGNIAGLAVCVVIATVLFAARTYVKFRIRRSYLVEDVTCTIAWVLLIFYASCVFLMISYNNGYASGNITRQDYAQMLKWLYISSLVYCPTAFFTKVTILLLIARVFTVRTGVTWAIHAFILVLALAYVPIEVTKIDICHPIAAYWDPEVEGSCLSQRRIFLADLGVSIATDFVILVVPVPLTWKMREGWRRKIKIVGMLGAGGSALAVTVYRLVLVIQSTASHGAASSDFILLDLLQIIEITIGIACSCLPAVNILLAHHFYNRRWLASLRGSGGTSGSSEAHVQTQRQPRSLFQSLLHRIGLSRFTPSKDSSQGNASTTITSDNNNHVTTQTPGTAGDRRNTATSAMVPRWEGGRGEEFWEDSEDRREWDERQRAREKGRRVDFDLELAMLSPGGRFPSTAPIEPHANDSWFVVERANSIDGRREGWLEDHSSGTGGNDALGSVVSDGDGDGDDDTGSNSSHGRHLRVDQPGERSRGASRDREGIEMELAKVTGNKPWEMIFDGRHNH